MGFHNPPQSFAEMRARLAGAGGDLAGATGRSSVSGGRTSHGEEVSRLSGSVRPSERASEPRGPVVPYAELHVHSAYSFLDGVSMPEQYVAEAHRLGLTGLAITDHDGLYGVVRMAEAIADASVTNAVAVSGAPVASAGGSGLGVAGSWPDAASSWPSSAIPGSDAAGTGTTAASSGSDAAGPGPGVVNSGSGSAALAATGTGTPAPFRQLASIYGAELSLGLGSPQNGVPDPEGTHLLVLAHGADGYHSLASAITTAQLAGDEKGRPVYDVDQLVADLAGRVTVLTGCRKSAVRRALEPARGRFDVDAAAREIDRLAAAFGRDAVAIELYHHGDPLDDDRNSALASIAAARRMRLVATGNVHYATPAEHRLAQALAAVRARRSIDDAESWLPAAGAAHLRSGAEMLARFGRFAGAVENTVDVAAECAFSLRAVTPRLPTLELPGGVTPMQHLRDLAWAGAERKYPGLPEGHRQRIEHELDIIERKDFPGYFLIVYDIVQFARSRGILCQGRGSAAASAVCYLLDITAVDAIFYNLPFERFLSTIRDEEPDIDVDFDSDRREEVIQYVYANYGRRNAAQVANVISYTPKNAVRDMAKALGFGPGQQDAWSKGMSRSYGPRATLTANAGSRSTLSTDHGALRETCSKSNGEGGVGGEGRSSGRESAGGEGAAAGTAAARTAAARTADAHATDVRTADARAADARAALDELGIPPVVLDLATQLQGNPRHLGIHSGGMVLTDRPIGEVAPIEHARMERRTVLQWDKDDCEWMGLVKFDLLGLGILSAIQRSFDLVASTFGRRLDLDAIPKEEPGVYDALCRADAIGVFQVESRAQLGLLPRLKPRCFYDLTIEVALIRPGPIQGGAVHPFVERRADPAKIRYLHPLLKPILGRTLGVPIFQEQIIAMAVALSDLNPEEADLLRRAFGSKRGQQRIDSIRARMVAGMRARGMTDDAIAAVYAQIEAFANFGFAESHSLSFALLVYASAWLKLHYPAAYLAGLLRAQPMGFYSAATLVADARRHGVEVLRPDILLSGVDAELEPSAPVRFVSPPFASPQSSPQPASSPLRPPSPSSPQSSPPSFSLRPSSSPSSSSSLSSSPSPPHPSPPHRSPLDPPSTDPLSSRPLPESGMPSCMNRDQPGVGPFDPQAPDASATHRRDAQVAVRLGLAGVRGIGRALAERIVVEREARGPYRTMEDLVRRVGVTQAQLESLATSGAFDSLRLDRSQALWHAGQAAQDRPEFLAGSLASVPVPLFRMPTDRDILSADLWATGISVDDHWMNYARPALAARGVLRAADLATAEPGRRVEVAGVVIHRQRPGTASGIVFLNLEDESGMVNVICSAGAWVRFRRIARGSAALIVRGILERSPEGVVNVVADWFEALDVGAAGVSRDFR